jgi:hypothetical protein
MLSSDPKEIFKIRNTASKSRCLSGKNLKYKKEEPAGTKQNEDKQAVSWIRIRIRIGSGFNGVPGSDPEGEKRPTKKQKN